MTTMPPTCESELGPLLLRPWRPPDAPALVDAVQASLDSVGAWLSWCDAAYDRADADAWIAHCNDGWARGEHFAFGIFDRTTAGVPGGVGRTD